METSGGEPSWPVSRAPHFGPIRHGGVLRPVRGGSEAPPSAWIHPPSRRSVPGGASPASVSIDRGASPCRSARSGSSWAQAHSMASVPPSEMIPERPSASSVDSSHPPGAFSDPPSATKGPVATPRLGAPPTAAWARAGGKSAAGFSGVAFAGRGSVPSAPSSSPPKRGTASGTTGPGARDPTDDLPRRPAPLAFPPLLWR